MFSSVASEVPASSSSGARKNRTCAQASGRASRQAPAAPISGHRPQLRCCRALGQNARLRACPPRCGPRRRPPGHHGPAPVTFPHPAISRLKRVIQPARSGLMTAQSWVTKRLTSLIERIGTSSPGVTAVLTGTKE